MASQNITINYPDGQAARIMAALKASAVSEDIPTPTNAQALAWFTGQTRERLRRLVWEYEQMQSAKVVSEAANAAAEQALANNPVAPVDVT